MAAVIKITVILPDLETHSFLDVEDKFAIPETKRVGILLFDWRRWTRLGRQLFAGPNRSRENEENR